jgi:maltose alpha-D-glucosyltransferase / alpha-amylase
VAQWATFLRNHDEVDLSKLEPAEREDVFGAFGPEEAMQLYGRGIRRRLAPMLGNDRPRIEMAYSLQFTLPGSPVLRYGDEIGMGDDLALPERDCARTPMQWSDEPNGGFTASKKPIMPVIRDGAYGFEHLNVAAQRRDPNSMLNWLERVCRMRKEIPEVGWGDFHALSAADPAVLMLLYEWRNNRVLFIHNLAAEPRELRIKASDCGEEGDLLINLLAENHSRANGDGEHHVVMEPYGYRWYRVGGLDYILKRSQV